MRWAIEDGKPVFGLCRGLQVINVAAGGTLWQDLASQGGTFQKHDYFPTAGFERTGSPDRSAGSLVAEFESQKSGAAK